MVTTTKDKYIEAVGRRKTSVARVRLQPATKQSLTINERDWENYFPTTSLRHNISTLLEKVTSAGKYEITSKITGGGIASQAGALLQGLARAFVKADVELKTPLKKEKYLSRDARMKERRKFGLKKARKAPQWSKR